MGHDDVKVTVVTPERAPLSLFGDEAAAAVAMSCAARASSSDRRRRRASRQAAWRSTAGRRLACSAYSRCRGSSVRHRRAAVRRGGLHAPARTGVSRAAEHTWAAGDGIVSPIKFGGLATHQARVAGAGSPARPASRTRRIRRARPARPPARRQRHAPLARAATPRARRCGGRTAPHEYLPRWLASTAWHLPPAELLAGGQGITVERPMRALRRARASVPVRAGREYRSDDSAIASLGRRMREARVPMTTTTTLLSAEALA